MIKMGGGTGDSGQRGSSIYSNTRRRNQSHFGRNMFIGIAGLAAIGFGVKECNNYKSRVAQEEEQALAIAETDSLRAIEKQKKQVERKKRRMLDYRIRKAEIQREDKLSRLESIGFTEDNDGSLTYTAHQEGELFSNAVGEYLGITMDRVVSDNEKFNYMHQVLRSENWNQPWTYVTQFRDGETIHVDPIVGLYGGQDAEKYGVKTPVKVKFPSIPEVDKKAIKDKFKEEYKSISSRSEISPLTTSVESNKVGPCGPCHQN